MIKKIHYFWFGGNPLPKKSIQYIDSWRKLLPDYKIIRWDESNFDVNANLYSRQAYAARKWAFVSDYARFKILEEYGGLYFDTDVEVIRPLGELLELDAFSAFETDMDVAPGLVLYSREPNHPIIRETRQWYDQAKFLDEYGERIKINVCGIFKSILEKHGFIPNGQRQECDGMVIFPQEYFCPLDDATGVLNKTPNTYSIHWYDKSWMPWHRILKQVHQTLTQMVRKRYKTTIVRKI